MDNKNGGQNDATATTTTTTTTPNQHSFIAAALNSGLVMLPPLPSIPLNAHAFGATSYLLQQQQQQQQTSWWQQIAAATAFRNGQQSAAPTIVPNPLTIMNSALFGAMPFQLHHQQHQQQSSLDANAAKSTVESEEAAAKPPPAFISHNKKRKIPPPLLADKEDAKKMAPKMPKLSPAASSSPPQQSKHSFCLVCDEHIHKPGTRSQGPRRHILTKHMRRPLFVCQSCGVDSPYDKSHISTHVARRHRELDPEQAVVDNTAQFVDELRGWYMRCFNMDYDQDGGAASASTRRAPRRQPTPPLPVRSTEARDSTSPPQTHAQHHAAFNDSGFHGDASSEVTFFANSTAPNPQNNDPSPPPVSVAKDSAVTNFFMHRLLSPSQQTDQHNNLNSHQQTF